MKNVLLSAFSCNPYKGSESANGWNWSVGIVQQGFNVHVLTRKESKEDIERHPMVDNLSFHYISFPFGMERLYSFSKPTMYLYYLLWQWKAYLIGKKLNKKLHFHRVHHVSWGSIQQGSFLYKLKVPFIFGPSGGGQKAPETFKDYFLSHWETEEKREKVSQFLFKYNPACRNMLKNASAVLVSNKDTEQFVRKGGAKKVYFTLDAALANSFFPSKFIKRSPSIDHLKLLWVGRFMPRKGLLLVLEVMSILKPYKGITLTVVGDGEMKEDVKLKASELGLGDNVSFTGMVPLSEVRSYYESHDLFLFTSLRDSCPAQLMEAMAFNLPIVTLDLHGQGQIVTDETGIRIPLGEPETVVRQLADAIVSLASDSSRYQSMSKAAFEFSRKQTWDIKIKDVINNFY
ncbi:glycosyltransferase family 4 protein [Sunxiuqinia indica]|uniref:glycosyltransferase family 4 protein n=1 Tax=Sunxiuqinia indica TaxID=2692584 RepID=UPI00135A3348|nr:glycosyltransferase family 4 protein [Sunxiuqinia indica]